MADDIPKMLADYYMADADSKESKFENWYGDISKKMGLSPDPYEKGHYYDYNAFYDAMGRGEAVSPDKPEGHWDSRFKSPDHPRRYLEDPESGRLFDTESGAYTGGDREMVPEDRMDRINKMDTPDLSNDEWLAARAGVDLPVRFLK